LKTKPLGRWIGKHPQEQLQTVFLFNEAGPPNCPARNPGEFYLREKEVGAVHAQQSLIGTEQLPEERILELARSSCASAPG
jgi:hypothetical protein